MIKVATTPVDQNEMVVSPDMLPVKVTGMQSMASKTWAPFLIMGFMIVVAALIVVSVMAPAQAQQEEFNLQEASLADRMSILEGGSLLQVGTPQTLYDQPADPFTASFLGEINRLEATVIQQSGNQVTLSLQEAGTLTALSSTSLEKNTRLNCYLRPERIALKDKGSGEAANRLDGEVIQKLFFGNRIQYRVRLTNDCVLNVRIPYGASAVWEKGASVSLIFAAKDVYLFSP